MKLIAIKTPDKVYITDNVDGQGYFRSALGSLLFDGKYPTGTYKENWVSFSELPTKIQRQGPDKRINIRWELKEGYPESSLMPKVLTTNPNNEDSSYYDVSGLYVQKSETLKGELEDVEFELEILAEETNFYVEKPKYKYTASLMTELTVHPGLHSQRPCRINGAELFSIIRQFVKKNIDGKYASVDSDYDFCFSVKKIIRAANPTSYTTNLGTPKRPKVVTKYNENKTVVVFRTAPKAHNDYPIQEGLQAKNYEELDKIIDEYLQDLISKINQPLVECAACDGHGVVLEKIK